MNNNDFIKNNNSMNNNTEGQNSFSNNSNSIQNNFRDYSQNNFNNNAELNNTLLLEKEILDNRGYSNVDDDNVKMIKTKVGKKKKNYVEKVDRITPKNFKKRRTILAIICLAVISSAFVVSGSFAKLTSTSTTTNTSKLEAGVLKLEFNKGNEAINLKNALPQTKDDALMNNREYQFTIINTGNIPAEYTLNLDNTCTTSQKYKINHKEITPDLCIPDKYIKVGLSMNDGEYKILTRDEQRDTFIIENGLLNAGASNNYKMKIWLSIDTPNEYNAKDKKIVIYSGNLNIIYNQIDTSNNSGLDNIENNTIE